MYSQRNRGFRRGNLSGFAGAKNYGGFRHRSSRPRRGSFSQTIDIAKFINKSGGEETQAIEIINTFNDFSLCPELKNNLAKKGFIKPTAIQDQAIKHLMEGRDLIGLANTGTGKTAAFLLPLIDKIFKNKSQKVLIIAPTRELALQIENMFHQLSWGMRVFSAVCVGGAPIYKQIHNLRRDPSFVIGTPGRLKDLGKRNVIRFESFQNIVIDEIDRMLDMGFIGDIREILNQLPKERQSFFFSATMPPKIRNLVQQFVHNPVTIEVKTGETAKNVDQDIVRVKSQNTKFTQLQEILNEPELKKVLIFSETKREVEQLAVSLNRQGFKAESIHGDKRQYQRQKALASFKNNFVNILIATDVAARGLDIEDITHVINYTIPHTFDDYIHRIGRTGRVDKKGIALTFV